MKYHPGDTQNWDLWARIMVNTTYGFDPLDVDYFFEHGLFFMEMEDVVICFSGLDYALNLNKQGFKNTWYDVDNDPVEGERRQFSFVIPEKDVEHKEIFISVESYYVEMIPDNCYLDKQ